MNGLLEKLSVPVGISKPVLYTQRESVTRKREGVIEQFAYPVVDIRERYIQSNYRTFRGAGSGKVIYDSPQRYYPASTNYKHMSRTKENGVTVRNRIFGNDRRTSLHHLGIALALFVAIFGAYYLMSFFNSYPIPFGPATFVVIVGIGLIASVLSAYWNNGLVVSFLLAISAPLSLVTAVDVLELAAPRAPYLVLASWAIAFGLGIGICGYLLGVVAAWLEQREERGR